MNTSITSAWLSTVILASVCASLSLNADARTLPGHDAPDAARAQAQGSTTATSTATKPASLTNQPLAPFQRELLEVAFRAASKMPLVPHAKNSARVMESVVDANLELAQAASALEVTEAITNWRRGMGYASVACYLAKHGEPSQAKSYLDLARKVVDAPPSADSQDWQRDRTRAKIATAHAILGDQKLAREAAQGLVDSEAEKLAEYGAGLVTEADFEEHLKALEAAAAASNFDLLRAQLAVSTRLYARFFADVDRRSRLEEKIKASWSKIPVTIRFEVSLDLARTALDKKDPTKGLALVKDARVLFDSVMWPPEHQAPTLAKLAAVRHRAGDVKEARFEIDGAVAVYTAHRDEILDIDRASALRPIAESLHAMGDTEAARKIYARAVDEGAVNPNSRPRVDDLAATCCSMAIRGVEPDEKQRARILQICDGLAAPW